MSTPGDARASGLLPSRAFACPPACLQHLEASVRRSNPGVDIGVMLVRGELGAAATQRVMGLNVTVIYVEPLLPEERGHASLQRG